jgi:hypothetical protein
MRGCCGKVATGDGAAEVDAASVARDAQNTNSDSRQSGRNGILFAGRPHSTEDSSYTMGKFVAITVALMMFAGAAMAAPHHHHHHRHHHHHPHHP